MFMSIRRFTWFVERGGRDPGFKLNHGGESG
jgi:hypothetical protein